MVLSQTLFRICTRVGSVFMWYTMLEKTSAWGGVWAELVSAEISGVVSRVEGVEVG